MAKERWFMAMNIYYLSLYVSAFLFMSLWFCVERGETIKEVVLSHCVYLSSNLFLLASSNSLLPLFYTTSKIMSCIEEISNSFRVIRKRKCTTLISLVLKMAFHVTTLSCTYTLDCFEYPILNHVILGINLIELLEFTSE